MPNASKRVWRVGAAAPASFRIRSPRCFLAIKKKSLNLYGFDDEFVLLISAHASMKETSRNSTTVNHASRCWRQSYAHVSVASKLEFRNSSIFVSKEELAKLVQSFEEQDILTSSGVTLAGNRYIYLSGTDRVIRAKLGKVGVHCMKTTQAVVVSLYEDPIQPQQAASVVEKLGEYLVSCGY
ncbi:Profilin [Acromyrmex echinatior]|uniref:Profilin n=1 Tax=Acromyrmex echinatior TaxID=103372 RepID=F4WA65_ACREC|nr:Profilin [Acromyrmex echinatior]